MGRLRLDQVSLSEMLGWTGVVVVAKYIEGKVEKRPEKDSGDEEYTTNCSQFEISEILYLESSLANSEEKKSRLDVRPGGRILVARSAVDMYHDNFVFHKKHGGHRSFAINVYKNADSDTDGMEPGCSYIIYACRCDLNSEILQFAAKGAWDKESEIQTVRKSLETSKKPEPVVGLPSFPSPSTSTAPPPSSVAPSSSAPPKGEKPPKSNKCEVN